MTLPKVPFFMSLSEIAFVIKTSAFSIVFDPLVSFHLQLIMREAVLLFPKFVDCLMTRKRNLTYV
jgi:hypothetical protein